MWNNLFHIYHSLSARNDIVTCCELIPYTLYLIPKKQIRQYNSSSVFHNRLENPPQAEFVRQGINLILHQLPYVKEDDPKIAFITYEFTPQDDVRKSIDSVSPKSNKDDT